MGHVVAGRCLPVAVDGEPVALALHVAYGFYSDALVFHFRPFRSVIGPMKAMELYLRFITVRNWIWKSAG